MPKRKAPTKLSGLVGSDDEDLMQLTENESAPFPDARDEPPVKRRRGRPRSSNETATESKTTQAKKQQQTDPASQDEATAAKMPARRGRPRGSSRTSDNSAGQARAAVTQEPMEEDTNDQENEDPMATKDTKTTRTGKAKQAATATRRGRGQASSAAKQTDGEFEYTPTRAAQAQRPQPEPEVVDSQIYEEPEPEVDESVLPEPSTARYVSSSVVKNARARMASVHNTQSVSPRKRNSGVEAEQGGDPELRRRIGDLTKKHDGLETKYRNLREIGIVEANTNMEKLRKQCESITIASNELVASLRSELEAQRALGQQSRGFQKQLKDRDAEMARLKAEADEARAQLSATQSEVKALQTKLAAARNTAASLESIAKVPGSAIKGGANRATAAVTAEAAQAAQLAALKEELYTDLTGLIIRDVKNRETDDLYDCIQTGVNGTLHFKLAIPKVSSAEYESAEFQYLPLLDANHDRDLVNILPKFLTWDITFSRGQASKFYTRVIDALTKRRSSSAQE
ncbi:Monopolin complex subunit Csm1/Pcs1 [Penicillium cinerascens]|uniref:Monopolin complex subunit Csm1/Pcs1 n=1 Tax=Penicillium cinerascens TaxID=70096 RepID=A0A9W9MI40_9EURO|nr:Monopolin complex subunit Csm1/Pcs1 [Penicillium cinerascens]KAJ5201766.1 Monopolin complex subunit Csm1/Pcs1 [Penicillium cinerascens]